MIIDKPIRAFVLMFLMMSVISLGAQNERDKEVEEEFPTPIAFPYDYLGSYSGNLNTSDNTGVLSNKALDFRITASDIDSIFNYQFSYMQGEERIVNEYRLYLIDEQKGFYVIKDKNGLEFMATFIQGILYITYEVNDSITFTTLQFTHDGKLRFNVIVSKKSKSKNNVKINLSNVVQVQKALLSKI